MSNPELIFNFWAIHDPGDRIVYGLAGRVYHAGGTDEEKMDLLKKLAASDFVLATRMPVPDRFSVEAGEEKLVGYCAVTELFNPETTLFKELLHELQAEIVCRFRADARDPEDVPDYLKIPENPLYLITTLVEGEDGNIVAIVGD